MRRLLLVGLLFVAGCPRWIHEPSAEPAEVEIDWPDAGVADAARP